MHEHGTKITPVFLPAEGETSWLLLPSLVSLLSGCTVQPENTYSSRWQVRPAKAKKLLASTLIAATTSIHLPNLVSTDLTMKPDSDLTNSIGKDGVRSWLM